MVAARCVVVVGESVSQQCQWERWHTSQLYNNVASQPHYNTAPMHKFNIINIQSAASDSSSTRAPVRAAAPPPPRSRGPEQEQQHEELEEREREQKSHVEANEVGAISG